jgi:hypothetical protein
MFSMVSRQRSRLNPRALLPLAAALALCALLGHSVADATNLWAGSTPPAASKTGFDHGATGRQDAASTLHTGFAVAVIAITAAPAVLSTIVIWTYPLAQFRLNNPPFRSPQTHCGGRRRSSSPGLFPDLHGRALVSYESSCCRTNASCGRSMVRDATDGLEQSEADPAGTGPG